jgi:predicted RNA-binding Zn ribbon-like protein
MRLSRKYGIPAEIALVYDFVNSLDLRRFVHHGVQHVTRDELETPEQLSEWMASRGLLIPRTTLSKSAHAQALRLRAVLRDYIQLEPGEARRDRAVVKALNEMAAQFPLVVDVDARGKLGVSPSQRNGVGSLAAVLGELEHVAAAGRLDRLKMCASAECRWIFFDRSKPSSRRWCVSALCGNREKTRTYRRRHHHERDARQNAINRAVMSAKAVR